MTGQNSLSFKKEGICHPSQHNVNKHLVLDPRDTAVACNRPLEGKPNDMNYYLKLTGVAAARMQGTRST